MEDERITVQEKIGWAISAGNLNQNAERESASDRIAALAITGELASCLYRIRYGGQVEYRKRAVLLLAADLRGKSKRNRWKLPHPDIIERLAGQAIIEWMEPLCPECRGRKFVGLERLPGAMGVPKICPACSGNGTGKISQAARSRALGVSLAVLRANWDERLTALVARLRTVDLEAARRARAALRVEDLFD